MKKIVVGITGASGSIYGKRLIEVLAEKGFQLSVIATDKGKQDFNYELCLPIEKFIKELNEKYDNKHILLVSHSVTVRVMLLSFLNSGVENIYRIKQDNTALNVVECRDYGPVVIKMNDTSHIKNNEKINNSALE